MSEFDLPLASQCAQAFSVSTGLGCVVAGPDGRLVYEAGTGCRSCGLCAAAGADEGGCDRSQTYGLAEATRFGGKYIYFCPMGLTCFVSPIAAGPGSAASLTAGPFLMVEDDDYISVDLIDRHRLSGARLEAAGRVVRELPHVSPARVDALATMLFMAVGFLNNVSAARMVDAQQADAIQGQVNAYIAQMKSDEDQPPYPFATEQKLAAAIADQDKALAKALLNEILGHILLHSGMDLLRINVRVYELLIQISRAAVDAGASPDTSFSLSCEFFEKAQTVGDIDRLCLLITDVMVRFIDSVFDPGGVKHVDVMQRALRYIRTGYQRKLPLAEVAGAVYLSPSYFSRLFKKEMGCTYSEWLNRYRVDKSKKLLLQPLRIVEVAVLCGFEDQSYFTKVFKRVAGVAPNRYREAGGRVSASDGEPGMAQKNIMRRD